MSHVENFVDELRKNRIRVKRTGKDFVIVCPYHDETKPSLSIDRESGKWHCFGCGAKGSSVNPLAKKLGITFRYNADSGNHFIGGKKKGGKPYTTATDSVIQNYFVNERGFSSDQFFDLRDNFELKKAKFGRVAYTYFPIKDFDGEERGWIIRSCFDKKYILSKKYEAKRYLYGEWQFPYKTAENFIVVEGVFDHYKTWIAGGKTVLAGLGFGGSSLKIARVINQSPNLKRVALFFDADAKEKNVEMWRYYANQFGLEVIDINLDEGDPGDHKVEQLKSILSSYDLLSM